MTAGEQIRDQLRRVVHGEAWHGPSVTEAIGAVPVPAAWTHPAPAAHSPVEIVLHIAAWLEIAAARFDGQTVDPTPEQDWPPADASSPEAWCRAAGRVHSAHAALDAVLSNAAEERIVEHANLLHGVVQHCAYHAGQLMLLARTMR